MTGEATSPRLARWAPAEWRGFAAFLRRPVLPERMTGIRFAAIGRVLQLFALDLVLMGLILGLIQLATAIGFHIPSNEIDKLKLTPLLLLLVIVLLPMGEEMVFRSWLSGRAGPMIALVVLAVGVAIPVISRLSLENIAERFLSCAPLRCMMFLNLEWPAMASFRSRLNSSLGAH
jgi:membrane protease YdiL (CAAX protease family)